MKSSIILVPFDFTPVAEIAVKHAMNLAGKGNGEVALLHVVEKKGEVDDARKKLQAAAEKFSGDSGHNVSAKIRVGNIFDDIGDCASEIGAHFIIMGTHGVKGIQHIIGSYALKVITNSKVPFIVVQDNENVTDYNNIVLPLDINKNTKQKLKFAVEIAQYFGSKMHLIYPPEDDEYLRNQLKRNIAFAKNYLKEHKVSFTTNTTSGNSFAKDVVNFGHEIDADLICIMNTQEGSLLNLFGGGYEQKIITNDKRIPAMIVNPTQTSFTRGMGAFG